jgi:thiol:disulfide interchange protein DsbA
MKKLFLILVLMIQAATVAAADIKEGVHYKAIAEQPTDTGDKIEVLEFFWYGCPHCYAFEPYIKAWKQNKPANVEFVRVPALFRPDWEVQARTYYALQNMGLIEDIHGKIFDHLHKDKKKLDSKEQMIDFLVSNGVDKAKFLAQYESFDVVSKVRKAKNKQNEYRIGGVPTVAVNGKYMTSGSMAGSYGNMVKIIEYLVAKESAARDGAAK